VTERHALYRFYGSGGELLYIGISRQWPDRFKQHGRDKYWFGDIARIEIEYVDSRERALDEEKRAIQSERPLHNVTHNDPDLPRSPELRTVFARHMLRAGQHVALGLTGDRCPVGRVVSSNPQFVTLQLKDWISGYYWGHERSYRWDDVVEVVYADDDGRVIHDDHLATFQTRWLAS